MLLVILLIIAFLSGAELFAVMLGASALGAMTAARGFTVEFDGMVTSMFGQGTGDQATVLSTIPMFIYAGYVLAEAKTADRLVRFANAAMGWMPGGLAIVIRAGPCRPVQGLPHFVVRFTSRQDAADCASRVHISARGCSARRCHLGIR